MANSRLSFPRGSDFGQTSSPCCSHNNIIIFPNTTAFARIIARFEAWVIRSIIKDLAMVILLYIYCLIHMTHYHCLMLTPYLSWIWMIAALLCFLCCYWVPSKHWKTHIYILDLLFRRVCWWICSDAWQNGLAFMCNFIAIKEYSPLWAHFGCEMSAKPQGVRIFVFVA